MKNHMSEKRKEIQVTFRRKDFEEIYFANNQGNIFLYKELKTDFIITVISLPLSVLCVLYFNETGRAWFLPFILSIVFLISFSIYCYKLWHLLKWKKGVTRYINELEKRHHLAIKLTDDALTNIEDEKITIIKWSSFQNLVITADSIFLSGPENYFLPRKSVSETDFNFLKEFITTKIQGE
jgi:hypothetical protein